MIGISNVNINKHKHDYLLEFVIMLYMLHMVPYIGYKTPASLYACTIILLYLVVFKSIGYRYFFYIFTKTIPIFGLIILDIVRVIWKGGDLLLELYSALQLIILPTAALSLWIIANPKMIRRLLYFQLMLWGITAVTTYLGCMEFPLASRSLAQSLRSDNPQLYGLYCMLNIGGFQVVYSLVLCVPFMILSLKKNVLNKIFCLVFIYVVFLAIRQSEYTTALIMLFLSFLLFFMPKKFDKKMFTVIVVFGIFAIWYGTNYLGDFLLSVSEEVESASVSSRLESLGYLFNGDRYSGNGIDDLESRQDLFMKSIEIFKKYPILGSWNPRLVGGHSLLFDTMGKYGIIGIMAYVIMYYNIYILFIKKNREDNYGYVLFNFLLAIGLGILNPHVMYYYVLFFMPISYFYAEHRKV